MKINKTNSEQLLLHESATAGLVGAIILSIVGAIGCFSPIFISNSEWWYSLVGVAFIGAGIAVLFTAKSTDIVLNRAGASTVTKKKLIGGKSTEQTFNTNSITFVGLETQTKLTNSMSSDQSGTRETERERTSVLYLQLADTTQIPLASKSTSGGGSVNGIEVGSFGKAPLANEAQQIADFLGVPLSTQSQNGIISQASAASPTAPATESTTKPILMQSATQQPLASTQLQSSQLPVQPTHPEPAQEQYK